MRHDYEVGGLLVRMTPSQARSWNGAEANKEVMAGAEVWNLSHWEDFLTFLDDTQTFVDDCAAVPVPPNRKRGQSR